jgi:F0F1-type ATP synthase membrane subunit c/vacuolar-type H+-ATPase subunit K
MKITKVRTNLIMFLSGAIILTCIMGFLYILGTQFATLSALSTQPTNDLTPYQTTPQATPDFNILGLALGAALAIGLTGLGASLGMATTSAAALGALTEQPEVFIEAVAIYGFVIAFLLISYIPDFIP